MRVENTYSNDCHNFRKHFKMIKIHFDKVEKIGIDRFM